MQYQVYDRDGRVVAMFAYRDDAVDFADSYYFTWGAI